MAGVMAESSSSSIDITAGGRALRAAGEIDIALLELQRHLDEEVAKATPAAPALATAAGETGEAPAQATEVIKGDPLLHALLRCSRQLTKLRHSLLAQVDGTQGSLQRRGRPVAVTNEGRKAQSTLLHAQQIADDMYHGSLAQLNDPFSAETGYHSKVLDTVQSCDRANAVTASALTLVISALSGFPPHSSALVTSGSGGAADVAGAAGDGDSGGPAESRTEGQPSSLEATPLGNSSPERIETRDAGRPVAAAAAAEVEAAAAARAGARARARAGEGTGAGATTGGEGGAAGSAGSGYKNNSGGGVYRNQGIPRGSSGSVRSCRSQAAAAAGVGGLWRAGRNTGVERGTRVGGAQSAAVAAWGAAPPKATATEMAVSLGLAPVTRGDVAAAAEDRKRRAASLLRVAMSGSRAGGAEGVEGYGKAGGGEASAASSAAGRQDAAIFQFESGKPSPVERQRRRQQQTATSSVEAMRRERPPTSAAWLDGASSGDWLTNRSGEGASSHAAAQEAAGASGKPSTTARGAVAAAAAASSRRIASGHRSPSGSLVSARLASPEHLRSAGRTALDVRRRLVAAGSGSGSSEERRRSSAAAAVRNRGGPSDADEEQLVNAVFDEASYRAILDNVPAANGSCPLDEERLANALFDEASYRAILGERPTLTGSRSPPSSLSAPRAVARRRGMIGVMPPAGPGRGGRGPGRWDSPSTPLVNDGRSQGDSRLLSSASSQVLRPREASAAAAAAAAEPPQGIDEDEVGQAKGVCVACLRGGVVCAAARRIAKQEQEAQAREDELLALRLAAREEAGAERRASRRRVQRRSSASSARRNAAAGYISPDSNHPAVASAAGGDRGGGAEGAAAVSDAIRALQFQDIDENDFETLLALDEAGGEGGRCCAGGKGLAEEAMEAALQAGTAAGARLEESCAVCMEEFGLGDEISVLPCLHAFHGACIRKWLLMRNRCPTCLKAVIPDSPQ
ncbi:unnamed protein product [Ectocarpus sp. CCAP 1310/34]|nr:unnamed protein product [Ectocarpus sp. CCAP 1310/34]